MADESEPDEAKTAETQETSDPAALAERPRRRGLTTTLVVVATILAFVSLLAIWANRQFLNTDNWTKTSSQLLQKQAVREQVAGFLVDQVYANVNVQGLIAQALPPQAKPLAGPAAGSLRNAAEQGVDQLLTRPKVQELWQNANRLAQKTLLATLEGGNKNVSTNNGDVVLNLGTIAGGIANNFGLTSVAAKIPPDAAQITVLHSDQLDSVQSGLQALRGITIFVVILTLLLYVAAVFFSGRRREALRAVGWSLIVAGVLALITRGVVGSQLVDSLASTASVKPAVSDVWDVATSQLVAAATATIAYGVVIILGAWLAGGTRWATSARSGLAPVLRDPRFAFGALGVIVLVLIVWGPTPATTKPLSMLFLIILLALGVEALRRVTAREHPDASFEDYGRAGRSSADRVRAGLAAGGRAVSGGVGHLAAARHSDDDDAAAPTAGAATTAVAAAPAESTLAQLERLGKLRDSGVLDDAEFKQEKAKVLAADSAS